jgi:flagellar protein FlaG
MLIQNATSGPIPAPRAAEYGGSASVPASKDVSVRSESPPDTAQPVADPAKTAQPTAAQLKDAVDNLNNAMKQIQSDLEFSIDKDTHRTIIKVVDSKTGDTIKQFPSEDALAIMRALDKMQGLLVRQKA